MEFLKKTKKLILILPFIVGFRSFVDYTPWDISNDSEKTRKIFVSYTNASDTVSNDVKSNDVLASEGDTVTVEQLMDSIFDNYNNINAAFVTLVDSDDADYDERKEKREITISFDGASGGNAGEAQLKYDGDKVVECKIDMDEDLLDSAKDFLAVMTHEIGHCLGLDHPQESVNAIMSYYVDPDVYRLLVDDMMGIVHLYPKDKDAAAEESTFGLACDRK